MASWTPAIWVTGGEGGEGDEHQEVRSYLLVASDGAGGGREGVAGGEVGGAARESGGGGTPTWERGRGRAGELP